MTQDRSRPAPEERRWTLLGRDGAPWESATPGSLGGHRKGRLYGLLNCRAAAQAIARGGYVQHRVFFADEATAVAAGYRPCAVCLPRQYAAWKKESASGSDGRRAETRAP